jgi:hypothetical protein
MAILLIVLIAVAVIVLAAHGLRRRRASPPARPCRPHTLPPLPPRHVAAPAVAPAPARGQTGPCCGARLGH